MAIGKAPKHEGLQEKLEKLLQDQLRAGARYSTKQLQELVRRHASTYSVTNEEVADIKSNWPNYAFRAKRSGVLEGLGRRRGYKLGESITEQLTTAANQSEEEETRHRKKRVIWESFLHFPATLVLSHEYGARVYSLPQHQSKLRWANPDMLMSRYSMTHEDDDSRAGSARLFQKVDATPTWILTSVELKYDLENDRAAFLNALSETAINGSWANENMLVYFQVADASAAEIDEDVLAFARNNGIGIVRIAVESNDDNDSPAYSLRQIAQPNRSTSLGFDSTFTGTGRRRPLVSAVAEALEVFESEGSYIDENGAYVKLATLLNQCLENLAKQASFSQATASSAFESVIKSFNSEAQKHFSAIWSYLPFVLEADDVSNPIRNMEQDSGLKQGRHSDRQQAIEIAKQLSAHVS